MRTLKKTGIRSMGRPHGPRWFDHLGVFRIHRIVPRRLLRLVDKFEASNRQPVGHYAAVGFLSIIAVYGLSEGGHLDGLTDQLATSAGFGIDNIEIDGSSKTSELTVLQALDLEPSRSLVTLDANETRSKLEELPWVKSASVRKYYPDTLAISVTERNPFAIWQLADELSLIDDEGVLLGSFEQASSNLPLIVGHGANENAALIINAINDEPQLAERITAAIFVAGRRWNLRLDDGLTIKLPEANPNLAIARFAGLNESHDLLGRDIVEVDLRLSDRLTVRLASEAAQERLVENEKIGRRLARLGAPI